MTPSYELVEHGASEHYKIEHALHYTRVFSTYTGGSYIIIFSVKRLGIKIGGILALPYSEGGARGPCYYHGISFLFYAWNIILLNHAVVGAVVVGGSFLGGLLRIGSLFVWLNLVTCL